MKMGTGDPKFSKFVENRGFAIKRQTWSHFVNFSNSNGSLVQSLSDSAQYKHHVCMWCVCVCVCSLRQVKIEQRKLNDSSNSLVDMAKVRH